jgi:hypothetical protein
VLQNPEEHGGAGHDDFRAPRSDAVYLPARRHAHPRDPAVEAANLRGGGAKPFGGLAVSPVDTVDGAHHRRGCGRSRDNAVHLLGTHSPDGGGDLFVDKFIQPAQLHFRGRIALEEALGQAHRAQRLGDRLRHAPALAQNDLRAASAHIDDENATFRMGPARLDPQVNQPRLFLPGNDLDRASQSPGGSLDELVLVGGVAHRGRRHGAHADHIQLAVDLCHTGQVLAEEVHRFDADASGAEDAFAEPRHLPVGGEDRHGQAGNHLRGLHAHRVASDIHSGVPGHTAMIRCSRHRPAGYMLFSVTLP